MVLTPNEQTTAWVSIVVDDLEITERKPVLVELLQTDVAFINVLETVRLGPFTVNAQRGHAVFWGSETGGDWTLRLDDFTVVAGFTYSISPPTQVFVTGAPEQPEPEVPVDTVPYEAEVVASLDLERSAPYSAPYSLRLRAFADGRVAIHSDSSPEPAILALDQLGAVRDFLQFVIGTYGSNAKLDKSACDRCLLPSACEMRGRCSITEKPYGG